MKKAEPQIRSLFTQYNDTLSKKKKEISEALTKWSEVLIAQVKKHVADQQELLEQHFTQQKRFLENERKRLLADVAAEEKKKDNEQIDRLLAECKALKLNLPVHEEFEQPISWIRVTTEKELAPITVTKTSTQKPEENPSQNGLTEVTDNGTGNTASGSRRPSLKPGSATARPPSRQAGENRLEHDSPATSTEINTQKSKENQSQNESIEENSSGTGNTASGSRRPSLKPGSATARPPSRQAGENRLEHDSSATGTDASKSDEKSENELMDKCPICFMIFPKSMGKQDRLVHADEHYTDD